MILLTFTVTQTIPAGGVAVRHVAPPTGCHHVATCSPYPEPRTFPETGLCSTLYEARVIRLIT
ncbi:hypothetical protein E2C01_076777 [Portunus trituberculatus]|uniref:Uncharacterized protein n=1 Tax=Portunus trituberculatus TaxID=210409 RepID=A0A5B7I9L9_PORTR|nr:hypothetical protein [Portunus trituberculatus]